MNENIPTEAGNLLIKLRNKKPLIHHITNYVTVNDCANIVLAIGASPIMADDIEEVKNITSISSALVVNIGTLNQRTVLSMIAAGKSANEKKIPVILDPVGAGASELRNRTVEQLLRKVKIDVLRGNMSEIKFISGLDTMGKGVDASESDIQSDIASSIQVAKKLAQKINCIVVITGPIDIISDGSKTVYIENGHKMLSGVTGTGCMCTSLVGSFCGAASDHFLAAVSGVLCMGIAGEQAFENSRKKGIGSFKISIFDSISNLDEQTILRMAKVYEY